LLFNDLHRRADDAQNGILVQRYMFVALTALQLVGCSTLLICWFITHDLSSVTGTLTSFQSSEGENVPLLGTLVIRQTNTRI